MDPNLPSHSICLTELLTQRKQETPNQVAYYFLPDGTPQNALTLTYRMLDQQARQLAAGLRELGAAGERVLLCYEPSLDYIIGFFGCLYAGAVAVPAYPPDTHRPKRTMPRLKAIIGDADAKFVLTQEHLFEAVQSLLTLELDRPVTCLAAEQLLYAHAPLNQLPPIAADDLAFLMYTSGSTGTPKGVMVSFHNIWHNLSHFQGFQERPCTTVVSWLPLFHDLGLLLGVLHPLYQGVPAVLMAPATFVSRPWNWLNAISHYQASTTGGANFAYELCIQRIPPNLREKLDLSHWNMALNGAEPVRANTLQRFAQTFAISGFQAHTAYPSYGMAEATATVTGGATLSPPTFLTLKRDALRTNKITLAPASSTHHNQEQTTITLVGCGQTLPGQTICIVDPQTLTPCPPYQVGEIWVAGPSIGQGYWQNPAATQTHFQATLATEPGKQFLRTGDLGFLHHDELFLTGRLKDIIIINGINHYPEDIEQSLLTAHPAIRAGGGCAFALETDGHEGLVIVHEINNHAMPDADELFESIRQTIAEFHNIETYAIVLIEPGTLLKTSSGKVRRHDTYQAFRDKQLALIAQHTFDTLSTPITPPMPTSKAYLTSNKIQEWLIAYIAQRQKIDPTNITITDPFSAYGMGSLAALTLINDLEVWLDTQLSLTLAWSYPNIQALAQHLAGQETIAGQEEQQSYQQEPIAIIGMSCRFPGYVDTPEALWQLLATEGDTVSEIPSDRWVIDDYYHPQRDTPGKMVTRWGSYIEDLDQFDADFFGISPREAAQLDPRQRLLLEGAWHALEDAGITQNELTGSNTGVFVAVLQDDYGERVFDDYSIVNAYSGSGTANAPIANRISYVLGLHGPSMVIDTACSGSLVAIHLACQSLSSGESSIALAGGVNIILEPDSDLFMSQAGIISPDGRCRTFDKDAKGIVRGEGMGLLVLKPLAKAEADNDHIYAVIRGTAVNHDGQSNGLMAPNGLAQEKLVRTALNRAGLSPADLQYVEAHGTGTELGDPIEVNALGTVLQDHYPSDSYCAIGSIKTNIGHTEAAAGIAGILKVIMAMRQQQLPATIHYREPNPKIPFDRLPITVQTKLGPWPRPHEPLIAGVSSFGFSGTNGHVILQNWITAPPLPNNLTEMPAIMPVSAKTPAALRQLVATIDQQLTHLPDHITPYDVGYVTGVQRTHFDHRLAFVGTNKQSLQQQCQAFLNQELAVSWHQGSKQAGKKQKVVFVFAGQGTQWLGMGQRLYAQEALFRATVDTCDQLIQGLAGWSLIQELFATTESSNLNDTVVAQIAIFTAQVGLAVMWRSWGVFPDMIVGQSLGEVAAAHIAGALSLADALKVVYHRSRLMQEVERQGLTAVIGLPLDEARLVITAFKTIVAVAGSSGPDSSVISGDPEAITRIVNSLEEDGTFARILTGVNIAFHSPQMDPLVPRLVAALADISPQPTSIPFISTVTGILTDGTQLDATYWGDNLRQPFVFSQVSQQLIESNYDTYLEISTHPVLIGAINQSATKLNRDVNTFYSLKRDESDWHTLLQNVAGLYTQGVDVHWPRLYPRRGQHLSWPQYAWQKERYWLDQINWTPLSTQLARKQSGQHPLLGSHTQLALHPFSHLWEMDMNAHTLPYLNDHQVQELIIMPGAAYVEMGVRGFAQAFHKPLTTIENLTFSQGLHLPLQGHTRVQIMLTPQMPNEAFLSVTSQSQTDGDWLTHITAVVRHDENLTPPPPLNVSDLQNSLTHHALATDHYHRLQTKGLDYGPTFQPVSEIWHQAGQALSVINCHPSLTPQIGAYHYHPTLLDACFQTVAATIPAEHDNPDMFLPVGLAQMHLYQPLPAQIWCYAQLIATDDPDSRLADIQITDADGTVLATIHQFRLQKMVGATSRQPFKEWFYNIHWQPEPQEETAIAPQAQTTPWLLFADEQISPTLISHFKKHKIPLTIVYPGDTYQAIAGKSAYYIIRPTVKEDYQTLLATITQKTTYQGIIYAWSNIAVTNDNLATTSIDATQQLLWLLQTAVAQSWQPTPRLWLITHQAQAIQATSAFPLNPAAASIWGLGRAAIVEHPELHCTLVDIDDDANSAAALFAELWLDTPETQLAWRHAVRYVARWQRQDTTLPPPAKPTHNSTTQPYQLTMTTPGMLDTFQYQASPAPTVAAHDVHIEMYNVGLNFKDIMLALGMLPPLPSGRVPLGLEGTGRVVDVGSAVTRVKVGDEVIVGADFCLSRYVVAPENVVGLKPDNLSFADGATILVAFGTAHYALNRLGQLQAGERVLIHTASGAVGQAAIQLAKLAGAEIFATAGTPEKRAFLRDTLQIDHVFDSRTLTFADEILTATDQQGVDVVLNTLAGAGINKSLSLLRPYGRFLELGKRDIVLNHPLAMGYLEKNISYFVVDFNQMLRDKPAMVGDLIDTELLPLFAQEKLTPISYQTFPMSAIESAFRLMAQAKHIGKVIIDLRQQELPIQPAPPQPVHIHDQATYLITGGMGGLGQTVAHHLVTTAGARHLVLTSRRSRDQLSPQQLAFIADLEAQGATIVIAQNDVANGQQIQQLITHIQQEMPPLRGVIHSAGVLADGLLLQMTDTQLQRVVAPKILGAWHLHKATASLNLDFFVLFSSLAAVLPPQGQSNYAAGNAFMDALAHYRHQQNLPALSLNWGSWAEVGMAANQNLDDQHRANGVHPISPDHGLAALVHALSTALPQLVIAHIDWQQIRELIPPHLEPPFLKTILQQEAIMATQATLDQGNFVHTVLLPATVSQRTERLNQKLQELVASTLHLDPGRIDIHRSLNTLGVDSIMAVELKTKIERTIGMISLSIAELLKGTHIAGLTDTILKQLDLPTDDSDEELLDLLAEIDDLSADELNQLLNI